MDIVVSTVFPVFAAILTGYFVAKLDLLGPAATDSLNRFVIWLALPAVLFRSLATAHAEPGAPSFLAAFGFGMVATFALALGLDRGPQRRLADRSIDALVAAYANTGFLGLPLMLALFGPDALAPAVLGTLMSTSVIFAVAIVLIEIDLHAARSPFAVARKVVLSLLRNPLIVAPALGAAYAATGLPLPLAVDRFVSLIGSAASPCALVTIGLFLAQERAPFRWRSVTRMALLKLLVQPALTALLALGFFHMTPLWSRTAVIMSALPTGTGPFMLARYYGRDAGPTASAILVCTVLSVATISALVAFLGHL